MPLPAPSQLPLRAKAKANAACASASAGVGIPPATAAPGSSKEDLQRALETQRKRARGLRTALRVAQRAGTVLAERHIVEVREAAAAQTAAALAAAAEAERRAEVSEARLLQLETDQEAHALLLARPPSWFVPPAAPTTFGEQQEEYESVPLLCPAVAAQSGVGGGGGGSGGGGSCGAALGLGVGTTGAGHERSLMVTSMRASGQAERGGLSLGDCVVGVSVPRPKQEQQQQQQQQQVWDWGWQWSEGGATVPDAECFAAMVWSLRQGSVTDGVADAGIVLWVARARSHILPQVLPQALASAQLAPPPPPTVAAVQAAAPMPVHEAQEALLLLLPSAACQVPDSPRCAQGSHRRRLRATTQLERATRSLDHAERQLRTAAVRADLLLQRWVAGSGGGRTAVAQPPACFSRLVGCSSGCAAAEAQPTAAAAAAAAAVAAAAPTTATVTAGSEVCALGAAGESAVQSAVAALGIGRSLADVALCTYLGMVGGLARLQAAAGAGGGPLPTAAAFDRAVVAAERAAASAARKSHAACEALRACCAAADSADDAETAQEEAEAMGDVCGSPRFALGPAAVVWEEGDGSSSLPHVSYPLLTSPRHHSPADRKQWREAAARNESGRAAVAATTAAGPAAGCGPLWCVNRTFGEFRQFHEALIRGGAAAPGGDDAGGAPTGEAGGAGDGQRGQRQLREMGSRMFGTMVGRAAAASKQRRAAAVAALTGPAAAVAAAASALPALPGGAAFARECVGSKFLAARRLALQEWMEAVLNRPELRTCDATVAFVCERPSGWADFVASSSRQQQ